MIQGYFRDMEGAKSVGFSLKKHGVSFRLATAVFRDGLALTIFDDEHSDDEDRWVTLGQAQNRPVLVVVHTSEEVSTTELHIRIISARRAEPAEVDLADLVNDMLKKDIELIEMAR